MEGLAKSLLRDAFSKFDLMFGESSQTGDSHELIFGESSQTEECHEVTDRTLKRCISDNSAVHNDIAPQTDVDQRNTFLLLFHSIHN